MLASVLARMIVAHDKRTVKYRKERARGFTYLSFRKISHLPSEKHIKT